MKGVLLAGGSGTRMAPFTKGVNKHLLPVGDRPMIHHLLQKFSEFGIRDVLLITGPEHLTPFAQSVGDGSEWNLNLQMRVQAKPGGIAQAVGLAESFVGSDSFLVMLGDNLFGDPLEVIRECLPLKTDEALVVLKKVADPERFGIAQIKNGKIIDVVEKPSTPVGDFCVTGIYAYTPKVFDVIREMAPSGRGEMEISDVNHFYALADKLKFQIMEGWWIDAGTKEAYLEAHRILAEI